MLSASVVMKAGFSTSMCFVKALLPHTRLKYKKKKPIRIVKVDLQIHICTVTGERTCQNKRLQVPY